MNKDIKLGEKDEITGKKEGRRVFYVVNLEAGKTISEYEKENNLIVLKVERPIKIYEYKEILDDKEKEYLGAVIKPFKKDIAYIKKAENICDDNEWICISLKETYIPLPSFKKGTMYKNMEVYKEYTLEELRL